MPKKFLFWFGSDFTHYCLAYYLQKISDAEFYSVVDITNKPKNFFKSQKLIDFKKTWYYHDHILSKNKSPDLEYLKKFEEKYKINLWRLVQNERIFLYFRNRDQHYIH